MSYVSPAIDLTPSEKLKTDNWIGAVILFIVFVIVQSQLKNAVDRCYNQNGHPEVTNLLVYYKVTCSE